MFANVLYIIALVLLSPLIAYRVVRHGRYRRGLADKMLGLSAAKANRLRSGRDCIWIHAVSVGEVQLVAGLVKRIRQLHPHQRVIVSTSTDTGYDLAIQRFGSDRVFFCPLDFSWAVRRTLNNLRPDKLVLAELELWPNLIRIARRQRIDVMVVNGRLSERSARRYQQFAKLTRPIFSQLNWVGCQDSKCHDRFIACGTPAERLQVTGSMKFDGAPITRETPEVDACLQWAGADPWHRVWVVGSTQPGEEQMALEIYRSLRSQFPDLRLILVPRHRERFEDVADLVAGTGFCIHRRSTDAAQADSSWTGDTVILIDTIGELRNWWGVGQIATVGGSFGMRGGQNMLEPAGYGLAVSFGPDTRNFDQIANSLIDRGGAVRVNDQTELQEFVKCCLTDIPAADALGRHASMVVQENRGATERTIHAIFATQRSAQRAA